MNKPKIIIADTDLSYAFLLQQAFAEEFFEDADIEIITDVTFFHQYFSTARSADILIVSDELYDEALQKHSIENIYLMMAHYSEETIAGVNITCIYKHSGISEIFSEITIRSSDELSLDKHSRHKPQIVLVCSAAGGVGKTTLAMGISACLTQNQKNVLYIDAAHLQYSQYLLENPAPIPAADIHANLAGEDAQIYSALKSFIRKEQFSYLPPFDAALTTLGLPYSIYRTIALSARESGDFDYIILDADAAYDEDKAELAAMADKVIIVTQQTAGAVLATNLLAANIPDSFTDKYAFLCNNFVQDAEDAIADAPELLNFTISEYIEPIACGRRRPAELGQNADIRRAAQLLS